MELYLIIESIRFPGCWKMYVLSMSSESMSDATCDMLPECRSWRSAQIYLTLSLMWYSKSRTGIGLRQVRGQTR